MMVNSSTNDVIPQAAVAVIETGPNPPTPEQPGFHSHNSILLLERTADDRDPWSGHLAFPGGRIDTSDLSLLHCAIRETFEECGIQLQEKHMHTVLPSAPAGRFVAQKTLWVQPFHFYLAELPDITLQQKEIAAWHLLKVEDFLDPLNHKQEAFSHKTPEKLFPCIAVGNKLLWGFTYGVLFRELVAEPSH